MGAREAVASRSGWVQGLANLLQLGSWALSPGAGSVDSASF